MCGRGQAGSGEDGEVQGDEALAERGRLRRRRGGPIWRCPWRGTWVVRAEGVDRSRQGVDELGGDAAAAVLDEAADRAAVEAVEVADALRGRAGRRAPRGDVGLQRHLDHDGAPRAEHLARQRRRIRDVLQDVRREDEVVGVVGDRQVGAVEDQASST